jgi:thiol-disulfide isomerase/thioredoxin
VKYCVIQYSQEWCGPCQAAKAAIKKNPAALKQLGISVQEIDPDQLRLEDERAFYASENVSVFPTFVVYRSFYINGQTFLKELGRFEGFSSMGSFLGQIKRITNKTKANKANRANKGAGNAGTSRPYRIRLSSK